MNKIEIIQIDARTRKPYEKFTWYKTDPELWAATARVRTGFNMANTVVKINDIIAPWGAVDSELIRDV